MPCKALANRLSEWNNSHVLLVHLRRHHAINTVGLSVHAQRPETKSHMQQAANASQYGTGDRLRASVELRLHG